MGLSSRRRFLNLIVNNHIQGARSLRQIDLTRHKLFNTTPPLPQNQNTSESDALQPQETTLWAGNPKIKNKNLRTIRLPDPIFDFRSSPTDFLWYIDCLPLSNGSSKILCADQSGRTALFDADTRMAEAMPFLHRHKFSPLSIFVPGAGDVNGGSLYIMDSRPDRELGLGLGHDDATQPSYQFESFVYRSHAMSWQHERLPRPPFVRDPKLYENSSTRSVITSHAVIAGGGGAAAGAAQVCLSVDRAGTYCLDTATHAWTQVGEWTLPFIGKVQYVPELKLWFGVCGKDMRLGAADLSAMAVVGSSQPPKLVGAWKEFEAPEGWTEVRRPQIVSLGSGRFCVARFFRALDYLMALFDRYGEPGEEYYTVLTGTDVVPCVTNSGSVSGSNGEVELRMIRHNSRCHVSYGSDFNIETVF
ncbi:unnamed protein product [Urochloa decumbens]|uniref:Uncharacterized protein n=1 Tax=Urochloa decumbens TaxID=240449 RepID=A0ABC9CPE4_9POAL